jgi:hypothetical protein
MARLEVILSVATLALLPGAARAAGSDSATGDLPMAELPGPSSEPQATYAQPALGGVWVDTQHGWVWKPGDDAYVAPNAEETPAAPPTELPAAPSQPPATYTQPALAGEWVNTQQYGWAWMPYADSYSYVPPNGEGTPYEYAYSPSYGWTWLAAPWVWGIGPWPSFSVGGPSRFGWYGHGWWRSPGRWHYHGPDPFRTGVASHGAGTAAFRGAFASRGVGPTPFRGGFISRGAPIGHGGGYAFAGRPGWSGHVGGRGGGHGRGGGGHGGSGGRRHGGRR